MSIKVLSSDQSLGFRVPGLGLGFKVKGLGLTLTVHVGIVSKVLVKKGSSGVYFLKGGLDQTGSLHYRRFGDILLNNYHVPKNLVPGSLVLEISVQVLGKCSY